MYTTNYITDVLNLSSKERYADAINILKNKPPRNSSRGINVSLEICF